MHAALGASTHPLPGTSPSGSFESELLNFMRNTPPRSTRASRRSKRRRSNPIAGFGWPHGMHLRRAATAGQHGLRSLTGLWTVCACNSRSSTQFVEITLQIGSSGACLKGTSIGGAQDLTLFVARTSFSLGSVDRCTSTAEFWQIQGGDISAAVQAAFLDSNLAAEPLTSWYTANGGVETTRWSEVVDSLGLQNASGSGEDGRELSPQSSVDVVGLTNNMSLDGDLSEADWLVQRVLTTTSSTENFTVMSVVEVSFPSAQRVLVLLGADHVYQIMQRIDLP